MIVRVLYFAAVREVLGLESEDVADDVRTVAELAALLERRHPALGPHLASVRFAVDETFAEPASPLHDGATVALIPPVAGG